MKKMCMLDVQKRAGCMLLYEMECGTLKYEFNNSGEEILRKCQTGACFMTRRPVWGLCCCLSFPPSFYTSL